MIISVILVAGVVCALMLAAGSLLDTAPAVVTGQVVTSEVTRMLRVDGLDGDPAERWQRDALESFVAGLDTGGWHLVSLEVAEDHAGHAIAIAYGPHGERRHACVAAGEDGFPVDETRRCDGVVPDHDGEDDGSAGD